MLKNHFIIAWRSLVKHKLQTSINIIGLAIGIAGCLTIFLLSKYELGFNKKITDADRIYRVYTQYNGQFSGLNSGVPSGVPVLAESTLEGAEVQSFIRTFATNVAIPNESGSGLKKLEQQNDIIIAGPSYFDLIQNYEWLSGSPRQSLSEPYQVVLTASKARKYFGMKDVTEAIGRELIYSDSLRLTVAGIINDPAFQSDFTFNDFISSETIPGSFLSDRFDMENWGGVTSGDQFFIKAAKGLSAAQLTEHLKPLNDRFNADAKPGDDRNEFKLQPLSDVHFNSELGIFDYSRNPAHKGTLYGLMIIAGLLLLIAAINFINLATVQATRRSKETGIRKVIGASKRQITTQFLVETALIALCAIPVAVILSEFAVQYFSEFLPEGLSIDVLSPAVLGFLISAVVVVTILAGFYPSLVMSSFNPAFAIKNQTTRAKGKGSVSLRKSLIVFQFVLAKAFIIGAFVMGQQMKYVLQTELGFEKESIVYFYTGYRNNPESKTIFKNKLDQLPEVKATTLQNKPPMDLGYQTTVMSSKLKNEEVDYEVHFRSVDTAYLNVYNIQLLAGRNLLPSDTTRELLINETFARDLGYENPEDAIGNTVDYSRKQVPIIGLVKDFHVRSFHHKISPLALASNPRGAYSVAAKINSTQAFSTTIDKMKSAWNEVYPGQNFRYHVLNETVEKMYKSEAQFMKLINTATGLAILISCLGLFGLTFFTVTQRAKEISIRKVLGASVAGVVALLSKDFLKLVIIALLIASPLAYYFMKTWLLDFEYRVEFHWWFFLVAGVVALIITFLTVSAQSLKAALANPSKYLRSD